MARQHAEIWGERWKSDVVPTAYNPLDSVYREGEISLAVGWYLHPAQE